MCFLKIYKHQNCHQKCLFWKRNFLMQLYSHSDHRFYSVAQNLHTEYFLVSYTNWSGEKTKTFSEAISLVK